ncbi:hypothetical protein J6590_000506 [Homalodisca vitripennis]|nr:hypothetical protein J6590_000506 [Homalodisca vitripennis]
MLKAKECRFCATRNSRLTDRSSLRLKTATATRVMSISISHQTSYRPFKISHHSLSDGRIAVKGLCSSAHWERCDGPHLSFLGHAVRRSIDSLSDGNAEVCGLHAPARHRPDKEGPPPRSRHLSRSISKHGEFRLMRKETVAAKEERVIRRLKQVRVSLV